MTTQKQAKRICKAYGYAYRYNVAWQEHQFRPIESKNSDDWCPAESAEDAINTVKHIKMREHLINAEPQGHA